MIIYITVSTAQGKGREGGREGRKGKKEGRCKGTLDLRSNRDLALVPTLAHQQSLGHIASGHPSPLDCLGAPDLTPSVQILIVTHASLYHLTDSHP